MQLVEGTVTVPMFFGEESLRMDSAASDDATRYHLNGVRIEFGERPRLVATDGHMLAIQDLEMPEETRNAVEGLKAMTIPSEFFKALRKVKQRERSAVQIHFRPKSIGFSLYGNVQSFTAIDGDYPDYLPLLPKQDRKETVVRFNPELLLELAEALGRTNGAALYIGDGMMPIRVVVGEGRTGLLMPMRA